MRSLKLAFASYCLVFVACASVSVPSIQESIAAATITVETLAVSVLEANESGQLSDEFRASAKSMLQQALNALQLATLFVENGDEAEAFRLLQQTTAYFDTVRSLLGEVP